jgi:hypothetical protein
MKESKEIKERKEGWKVRMEGRKDGRKEGRKVRNERKQGN